MPKYDAIVLGAGGVGSAALYELARRGARAVGIDRFQPPHDRGSTHGHTRVIRQAYFEHPDYVPLLIDAYRRWNNLERRTGQRLLHQIGLVEIGPADGVVVPGVRRAAAEHDLPIEHLSASDVGSRWPGLYVPSDFEAVFEPSAGYLLVEKCVRAHLDAALAAGAKLLTNTEVLGWEASDNSVRVHTTSGELVATRMIVAAGAWAGAILSRANLELTVLRKSLFWFECDAAEDSAASRLPVFLFELSDGVYYGFPKFDDRGVKVAEHTGGRVVTDPLAVDRSVDAGEQHRLTEFLATHLPGVSHRVADHAVCLYTMSPDEHFIVDKHPDHANVVFAAGLSGHGFKFTPTLGAALADIALDGNTALPVGFLSLGRFK
jgi:monomeric sarcosine oxidase